MTKDPATFLEQLANSRKKHSSLASKLTVEDLEKIRNPKIREAFAISYQKYQMQEIRNIEGVTYINDSYSTNLKCLWNNLSSLTNSKEVILIKGEIDKKGDYSILTLDLFKKINTIIQFGELDYKLVYRLGDFPQIEIPYIKTKNLIQAVSTAYSLSKKGDIVLFSPGCPSFEDFENYEDRGEKFTLCVNSL